MSTVIKVENISKQYRLGQVSTGTISHDVNRWWHKLRGKENPYLKIGEVNDRTKAGDSDYVWALQDINFEVKQGEVLGIIGRNGAGKSTLLKILSRTTAPTTGSIKIKGRVASLLEVGTGFHPELSGRENIYLNGAILGMTRNEIKNKFDEIVDFAGVERYIDTPVKRYSSGMYVRLAFAVAAHLEPDILIVDEVLAVGDAEFQKKALGKMKDVSVKEGRTVLFVSHNMAAVKKLCTKGILLKDGKILNKGSVSEIISNYLVMDSQNKAEWIRKDESSSNIFFNRICVINSQELLTNSIASEEEFSIHISLTALEKFEQATVSIRISNSEDIPIFTTSLHDCLESGDIIEKGEYLLKAKISENILMPGKYNLIIACFISGKKLFDIVENYISISIEDLGIKGKDTDRAGFVIPYYKWDKLKLD